MSNAATGEGGASRRWQHRLALVTLVALVGCDRSDPFSAHDPSARKGAAGLVGRPTLPEVVATYTTLSTELHAALLRDLGGRGWGTKAPSTPTALCQDFGTDADTGIRFLPWLTYDRFVADPQWGQVVRTISDTARRRGFDKVVHVVDRPDEHRMDIYDKYGAELSVQDGPRLLTIDISTGCHLRTGKAGA